MRANSAQPIFTSHISQFDGIVAALELGRSLFVSKTGHCHCHLRKVEY
ncbi:hypothetical protein [Sinorhizobium fredii]